MRVKPSEVKTRKLSKKKLSRYEVSTEIFEKILSTFKAVVVKVDSIEPYTYGYSNKVKIIYDGRENLIISKLVAYKFCPTIPQDDLYMQVLLRKNDTLNGVQKDITGFQAWRMMMNVLLKYYTREDLHITLASYDDEYNENLKQFHYFTCSNPLVNEMETEETFIGKYTNTYKYDINGAHAYELSKMLPKAKDGILALYAQRKEKPINKKLINYFVGCLMRKGYKGAYYRIVHNTSIKLRECIKELDGRLLYANTDGFVIQNPKHTLKDSKELGAFKLEYQGDTYIYESKNYWLMQQGEDKTGSALKMIRDKVDLRKGQIITYDLNVDRNLHVNTAKNQKEYKVEIKEIKKWQSVNILDTLLEEN